MFRVLLASLLLALPVAAASPTPEIVAHRGASKDAPENTVAAFKLAWQQGSDAAELDLYLTKDGQIAVIHDKDTKRTAGGVNKVVAESTLAELRTLDVGRFKGEQFAGEKIPTLAEMLATVPAGKRVFVEVKCGPEAVPEIDRVLKASGLPPARTPVISFKADVIAAMKKARPDLPAYWVVGLGSKKGPPPTAAALIAKAREIKADGLDLSAAPALDAAFVAAVRKAGLSLYVWTVDDATEARRLTALGVDGITTNRPGWLREQLTK